jgi:MYXO-CTERM domain-containing protein
MRSTTLAAAVIAALAGSASASLIPFNFPITPQQEVPPNNTNVAGSGQLLYDTVAHTFNLDVVMFGINLADITGYHIHNAPAGTNGPIVINLVPLGNFQTHNQGIELLLTNVPISTFEPALFAGNLYFNIHTTAFPSGQARGQIIPTPAGASLLAFAGLAAARRRRR